MNALPTPAAAREAGIAVQATLEDVLAELLLAGQPRLGVYRGSTWHCSVEMNTTQTGAEFKVRSQFDHLTPIAAALECRDRVREALHAVGGRP